MTGCAGGRGRSAGERSLLGGDAGTRRRPPAGQAAATAAPPQELAGQRRRAADGPRPPTVSFKRAGSGGAPQASPRPQGAPRSPATSRWPPIAAFCVCRARGRCRVSAENAPHREEAMARAACLRAGRTRLRCSLLLLTRKAGNVRPGRPCLWHALRPCCPARGWDGMPPLKALPLPLYPARSLAHGSMHVGRRAQALHCTRPQAGRRGGACRRTPLGGAQPAAPSDLHSGSKWHGSLAE